MSLFYGKFDPMIPNNLADAIYSIHKKNASLLINCGLFLTIHLTRKKMSFLDSMYKASSNDIFTSQILAPYYMDDHFCMTIIQSLHDFKFLEGENSVSTQLCKGK
ncbi:MAG: hypothetical protein P1U56_25630 [Saprospiraceae bacterium]|nr:hypothetical protein [Saprospiraceae bacterium]